MPNCQFAGLELASIENSLSSLYITAQCAPSERCQSVAVDKTRRVLMDRTRDHDRDPS